MKSVMEYLATEEDQVRLRRADCEPIKEEDLIMMALFGGIKDKSLAESVLAENYDLKTTIDTMKIRECSRANAVAMRGLAEDTELVKGRKLENYDTEEDIELMEAELKVMKLRRQGRCSRRKQGDKKKKCRNCNLVHIEGEECSAKRKTRYKCEGQDNKQGLQHVHRASPRGRKRARPGR